MEMTCPDCHCPDLYKEKKFPKKIGLTIIGIAIVASFWTYNLSLLVAALIDILIYAFIPWQVVCYRCKKVFKLKPIPQEIRIHSHHTAELYQYGKQD
jgi:hypothetical protein